MANPKRTLEKRFLSSIKCIIFIDNLFFLTQTKFKKKRNCGNPKKKFVELKETV